MVEQGLTYHCIPFSEVAIWKIDSFKYHHRDYVKKKNGKMAILKEKLRNQIVATLIIIMQKLHKHIDQVWKETQKNKIIDQNCRI